MSPLVTPRKSNGGHDTDESPLSISESTPYLSPLCPHTASGDRKQRDEVVSRVLAKHNKSAKRRGDGSGVLLMDSNDDMDVSPIKPETLEFIPPAQLTPPGPLKDEDDVQDKTKTEKQQTAAGSSPPETSTTKSKSTTMTKSNSKATKSKAEAKVSSTPKAKAKADKTSKPIVKPKTKTKAAHTHKAGPSGSFSKQTKLSFKVDVKATGAASASMQVFAAA